MSERWRETPVIAVGSGKGGVGKSTVTVNLAVALARSGYRVGLLDADILGYSVCRLLGVGTIAPADFNGEVLEPVTAWGVKMISMGLFTGQEELPLIWRGPIVSGILKRFIHNVNWGELDYLLIDLPPGTGDVALTIMHELPQLKLLVITTPQESAAHVAVRLAHMATRAKVSLLGLVENMARFACPQCGAEYDIFGPGQAGSLAQKLGTTFFGALPLEAATRLACDEGRPIVVNDESPSSAAYRAIARGIADASRTA
ncbi:P-loop NTPase [Heliobacterium gestii]|uniref:Iron-sulfur cluster carrier protein n=1 Tax=Heliomicrobium gestii TaxID=2699 RepID=A0A845L9R9_HELGE|nr:Mrp/NBP35 family ATP-binding protein [Heliomicrobium gestii]MBM7866246.1 ATP-binding protein involved in chromosome partitioning [Heliomicrobium gestii]MZP42958.1 P-loop NTPase [Heliomicrobium gestii]